MRKAQKQLIIICVLVFGCTFLLPAAASAAGCSNEALRSELSSARLPDCRAYELVSPTTKYGWPLTVTTAIGKRVVAYSLGGLASSQNTIEIFYDITRTGIGWQTTPFEEPAEFRNPLAGNVADENGELNQGLFIYRLANSQFLGERTIYTRALPGARGEAPKEVGPVFSKATLESHPTNREESVATPSVSRDLSRILFAMRGPIRGINYLWPGDTTVESEGTGYGFESLYEYPGQSSHRPTLVGLDGSGHSISQCGISLGFPYRGTFGQQLTADESYNAISADGIDAFFTAAAASRGTLKDHCTESGAGNGPPVNELFDRKLTPLGEPQTIAISEPSKIDCQACSPAINTETSGAVFMGASEDGSRVVFLSGQKLLAGAEGEKNLYEYNFDATMGTRVVLLAPDTMGVARVSEDGSHVYFVSQASLTGVNHEGMKPVAGVPNLYVSLMICPGGGVTCAEPTYRTLFIGTLSAHQDEAIWQQEDKRPISTTTEGRFAVFTSSADLTPNDHSSVRQVFEYDTAKETLTRISVGDAGFNDNGNTEKYPARIISPNYNGHWDPAPQLSSISDDGSVIVFESAKGLTSQALDGVQIGISEGGEPVYAQNVYEWHGGHVYLISDGQDRTAGQGGAPSTLLIGMDHSGEDIFFTTADQLVPQDGDTQQDVYDARANGGFSSLPAVPACEGDGCQGPLAPVPFLSSVASTSQIPGEQATEPQKRVVVSKGSKRPRRKVRHRRKRHATGGSKRPNRTSSPRVAARRGIGRYR